MESSRRDVWNQADEEYSLRLMPCVAEPQFHTTRERVDYIPSLLRRLG
ncbi:MAG: hypothetical protein IJW83_03430 [Clostridia bacterium]|nr:hypothetical protein [Clostridia bacterium]